MQDATPRAEPEFDRDGLSEFVSRVWDESIVPELIEYIKIPNQSPAFDSDWEANGYMARAVERIEAWCRAQEINGLTVEVIQLAGRTPVIYMEVPATSGADISLKKMYSGKPVLVVFYLGFGCLHCVEQLQAFHPMADEFRDRLRRVYY